MIMHRFLNNFEDKNLV